jgi:hypothetical protein
MLAYYHIEICILFWQIDRTSFEGVMVFKATFTDKLYQIMLYWVILAWTGCKFTTLIVIGTDCIGSYKPNYHIWSRPSPSFEGVIGLFEYVLKKKDWVYLCTENSYILDVLLCCFDIFILTISLRLHIAFPKD